MADRTETGRKISKAKEKFNKIDREWLIEHYIKHVIENIETKGHMTTNKEIDIHGYYKGTNTLGYCRTTG